MKLLLTSAGVKNQSIRDTIIELAGKPIEECDTLYIPTGGYPMGGPYGVWRTTTGAGRAPMVEAGWKSVGRVGAEHPQKSRREVLAAAVRQHRRFARWRWRRGLHELLDEAVGCGRAPAVDERALLWPERREHGDDTAHR